MHFIFEDENKTDIIKIQADLAAASPVFAMPWFNGEPEENGDIKITDSTVSLTMQNADCSSTCSNFLKKNAKN